MMFARTPRLMLRPGWPEDAAAWRSVAGHDAVAGLLPCCLAPAVGHDTNLPRLLIFLREGGTPRLIGGIALARRARHEAELGCWIAPAHRGRGYATEAGRAVIDMAAMLGLRRIAAQGADAPGGRLLAKLGLVRAGGIVTRHDRSREMPSPPAPYPHDDGMREPLAA